MTQVITRDMVKEWIDKGMFKEKAFSTTDCDEQTLFNEFLRRAKNAGEKVDVYLLTFVESLKNIINGIKTHPILPLSPASICDTEKIKEIKDVEIVKILVYKLMQKGEKQRQEMMKEYGSAVDKLLEGRNVSPKAINVSPKETKISSKESPKSDTNTSACSMATPVASKEDLIVLLGQSVTDTKTEEKEKEKDKDKKKSSKKHKKSKKHEKQLTPKIELAAEEETNKTPSSVASSTPADVSTPQSEISMGQSALSPDPFMSNLGEKYLEQITKADDPLQTVTNNPEIPRALSPAVIRALSPISVIEQGMHAPLDWPHEAEVMRELSAATVDADRFSKLISNPDMLAGEGWKYSEISDVKKDPQDNTTKRMQIWTRESSPGNAHVVEKLAKVNDGQGGETVLFSYGLSKKWQQRSAIGGNEIGKSI